MNRTIKNFSAPSATGLGGAVRRVVLTLALTVLTTLTAWADEPVKYIDENGHEQEVTEYTVLTGSETPNSNGRIELVGGTYVVNSSNLTYQHTIYLSGNTTLILADGANMTVEPTQEDCGICSYNGEEKLTIYGQKNQTGTLTVSGKGGNNAVYLESLTVNGGTITAYGEVRIDQAFTLNGGSLTVNKDATTNFAYVGASSCYVTINGGSLTINGGNAADSNNMLSGDNVYITGGTVTVTGDKNGIYASNDVTITGGTVNATATATATAGNSSQGIYCGSKFTMSGGTVTATGQQYGIFSYWGFTFGGGQLTANVADGSTWANSYGVYVSNGNSYIYYSHASDFIKASSYRPRYVYFYKQYQSDGYILVNDATPAVELSGYHKPSDDDYNNILDAMKGHKLTPKLCTVTLPNTVKPVGDAVTMDGSTLKAAVWLPVTLTTPGYENVSLTVKDADNADVTLTDGTFTMPNSDVTVTGTMTPIVYTISYDLCGGTLTAANPTTYTVESETFTLNNPAITGIDFLGWTGTDLDDLTTTVTIAQGSIGNRTYKANFDAVILQDGTAYTMTGDAEVKAATYIKTIDEQRVGRHQAWLVPFDYTLTQDDLDAFTFYKINMIANSPSPSVEATDQVWVFLTRLNAGAVLHANMPYVYKPKAEVTDYAFTTPNATLKAKNTDIILDTRTAEDIYSFYATYDETTTATPADPFYYVGIDGNLSYGDAVTVGPLRWIIRKTSKFGNTTSYAREMRFYDGENVSTGLSSLTPSPSPKGEGSDYWFSLDGRKLSGMPTHSGVYIVNGKKVVFVP